jgi:hypothetical protein
MASWQPKKLDLTKINSGARFNNGDGVNADDINAVVESSAFVQSLGENQPQLIEDGGVTSVSIDTTNNKFVFKNIKGQKGEQGIQGIQGERGEGVPSGGTVGQVLTKTTSGTAWEDAKGGGGGKSLLFLQGTDGYGLHQVFFKLPSLEGVKKVTISYTAQYDYSSYRTEYRNDNVVIYENGERLQDVYLYLLFDNSSLGVYDNVVGVPIRWDEYGQNEIELNFGIATENAYGQYGSGVSTSILFTLEY